MTASARAVEREIGMLSLADRWRLLRLIAAANPAVVRDALGRLPAMRRDDVHVRSWVIYPAGAEATEGVAGKP